ncbi:MAG: tetratricopeptide repeat protein, partial [Myxococcota bacterium]
LFLAIHNLADFNLALTGLSLPATLVATVLVANPHRSRRRYTDSSRSRSFTRLPRRGAVALTAAGLVLTVVIGPSAISHRLERDTEWAKASVRAGTEAFPVVVVRRHPSDFVLPLMAAVDAVQKDQQRDALRWLNRSMLRAPREPMPHRIAARVLWGLGARGQAMLELRLADDLGAQTNAVVAEALALTEDTQWLGELIGESTERRLATARALLNTGRDATALSLVDHPATRGSADFFAIQASAAERRKDYESMLLAARSLRSATPDNRDSYVFEAKALIALKDADAAVRVLQLGIDRGGPNARLMRLQVDALLRAKQYTEAKEIAKTLIGRTSRPQDAGAAHALLGRVYLAEGQTQRALLELEKARDRLPNRSGLYLQIANLRERLGNTRGALSELTRLEAVDPGNAAGRRMRERIEADVERARREREAQEQKERLDALLGP